MHKKYYNGLNLNDFEKEIFGLKKKHRNTIMNKKIGRNEKKYWNFDSSFFIQLYADLNAFVDSSERACVDMTYHKYVDTKGVERTQIGMINYILCLIQELHSMEFEDYIITSVEHSGVKEHLIKEEVTEKLNSENDLIKDILMNLAIVMPSLWN